MLDHNTMLRPTCAQVLNSKQWLISKSEIQKYGLENPLFLEDMQDNFFKYYFESRIDLLKNSIETNSNSLINIFRKMSFKNK